jgi:hypothetical protein
VKSPGLTWEWRRKRVDWSETEGCRIPGVAVKCVDIGKNISGEGDNLGLN